MRPPSPCNILFELLSLTEYTYDTENAQLLRQTRCPPKNDVRCVLRQLQGTDKYVLRMADDDWDPDLDFPGLDSSAVITDVGVDQFVLCHQVRTLISPCSVLSWLTWESCLRQRLVMTPASLACGSVSASSIICCDGRRP